ncbi:hypothetical protein [Pseudomonas violetae]|uniref:Uncharacterized protein n=1 Tax=Pseudomonas violetae TaxID=2915813 RepID=A0ABT0ESV2_9PSED|nr:hypothetical protein [Pseudomonas violetae]MCK1788822.1 hypothetical protein [Pseudomonas violetae]
MGDDFQRVDIGSRLDFNLGHVLGNDARDKLRAMALGSPAAELVKTIVQHFPILTSLFQAGAFYREFALPLLYMGSLQERLSDTAVKLSQPDRLRIEMAITVLVMELPDPFSSVLLGTSEQLVNMLPERAMQRAAVVAKVGRDLDALQPLSEQMDMDSFADIIREVHLFGHNSVSQAKRVPRLLDMAESHALALRSGENLVGIVYSQFCSEFALPQWAIAIDAMVQHASAMELPFDHKTFQRDLIGRAIVQPKGQTEDAIQLLRSLITATYSRLDPAAFLQRADKQLAKVRELELQIATLGANLTVTAMAKIGALAEAGGAEIKANRGWFKDELENLLPVVRAWQSFYAEWDRLHRKVPGVAAKSPASLSVVEKLPVQRHATAVVPQDVQHIQAELESAHATIEQNATALMELRTENFNLRSVNETLTLANRRPECLAVSMDLMRRIAIREAITPTDVLLFVEATSEGRVVVLDSAWKSAKEAATFQSSARMLEVISAMVFGYYDSIMSGNPDATARALLGKSYSANESENTSSNGKLRALREFHYLGRPHYFERHLKVGNGSGLEGMRVHFDIIDGKVVIAYAGPHLEVWSSN